MKETIGQIIGILVLIATAGASFLLANQAGRPFLRRLFAEPGVVARFFLATFVIMPAIAVGSVLFGGASGPVWAALTLMSIAPPNPSVSTKVLKLGGDHEIAIAWATVALLISIVTIPVTLVIIERVAGVSLDLGVAPVVRKIAVLFLVPTILGFIVRNALPAAADRVTKIVKPIVAVAQILLVVALLFIVVPMLFKQGVAPFAIVLAFVALAIVVGHLLGGPPSALRPTLAATLATRFVGPPLALAGVNNLTGRVAPALITYLVAGAILMPLYGRWLKARASSASSVPSGGAAYPRGSA